MNTEDVIKHMLLKDIKETDRSKNFHLPSGRYRRNLWIFNDC
ncbi:hypothetical protein J2S21_001280 [Peribacillus cavernae]|nr:hypothetical protein [Peribacillus cavernae]